jgi:hypothetical protein
VSPDELKTCLLDLHRETAPPNRARWIHFITRNWWQKLAALVLTGALWFVLVFGAERVHLDFTVQVGFREDARRLRITHVEPREVRVSLSGPRRAFFFVTPENLRLQVRIDNRMHGTRWVPVVGADMTLPDGIVFEDAEPRQVRIEVEERNP